jgi:hypothetical protein
MVKTAVSRAYPQKKMKIVPPKSSSIVPYPIAYDISAETHHSTGVSGGVRCGMIPHCFR